MKPIYWAIRGYDSIEKIYERFVPLGSFTDRQIQEVLRALVAKASLDFDGIIGAYAKRRTQIGNDLLSVYKDGGFPQYQCGENPYFVAQVADALSIRSSE